MSEISDKRFVYEGIEVTDRKYARWLALHGYAIIVGTGQVVDDDGKVTRVVLVRRKELRID